MGAAQAAIPTFALYGEAEADAQPAFAHIETIAVRSALHDWEIAPHRHTGFVQILLVHQGQATVVLDSAETRLDAPGAVVVPIGQVHGFRFAADTIGHVLTLSADFVARAGRGDGGLLALLTHGLVQQLPADDAAQLARLGAEMLTLIARFPAAVQMHSALAEAVVRLVAEAAQGSGQADGERMAAFRTLVERHYREGRGVEFYAARLGMTRRTLSRLCRARTGQGPAALVDARRALEARRLLRFTSASAAQVAVELGFDDPSWFSRWYLRLTGQRPGADRGNQTGEISGSAPAAPAQSPR